MQSLKELAVEYMDKEAFTESAKGKYLEVMDLGTDLPIEVLHEVVKDKVCLLDELLEFVENNYVGRSYECFRDFVEQEARETLEIPDNLDSYIDFKAMANDWKHDYYYTDFEEQLFIFRNS